MLKRVFVLSLAFTCLQTTPASADAPLFVPYTPIRMPRPEFIVVAGIALSLAAVGIGLLLARRRAVLWRRAIASFCGVAVMVLSLLTAKWSSDRYAQRRADFNQVQRERYERRLRESESKRSEHVQSSLDSTEDLQE